MIRKSLASLALAGALLAAPTQAQQPPDFTVTLTEEERIAALALFDIAVKARGIEAAEAVAVLAKKLQRPAAAPPSNTTKGKK